MSEVLTLGWHQFRLERKQFWRNPSAAFFGFVLPIVFLLIIGALVGAKDRDIVVPGIAGMNVMASTFNALGMNLTFRREQGLLKRMRGTPMPTVSYLGGILGNVAFNARHPGRAGGHRRQAAVRAALAVSLGRVGDLHRRRRVLVQRPGHRFRACDPELRRSAGVHELRLPAVDPDRRRLLRPRDLVGGLSDIARVMPISHFVEGLRGSLRAGGGLSHHTGDLAVLALWGAAGLWFAVRGFSWDQRKA